MTTASSLWNICLCRNFNSWVFYLLELTTFLLLEVDIQMDLMFCKKKVENTDVEGNVQFFQSRKSKAVKTCFLCVVLELFPISFSTQSSLTLSRTQREEEPQVTDDFSLLSWGWNRIYLLFPKGLNVLLSNNITPLCHCWRVVSKTLLYQQQKANYVKSYIQKKEGKHITKAKYEEN